MDDQVVHEEMLNRPAFERFKVKIKTALVLKDGTVIEALEPYRAIRRLLHEGRTHVEVTMRSKKKILLSVYLIATMEELA